MEVAGIAIYWDGSDLMPPQASCPYTSEPDEPDAPAEDDENESGFAGGFFEEAAAAPEDAEEEQASGKKGGFKPHKTADGVEISGGNEWFDIDWEMQKQDPPGVLLMPLLLPLTGCL
jgi:hypothetical protein